jgi:hypothetical protein
MKMPRLPENPLDAVHRKQGFKVPGLMCLDWHLK